MEVRERLTWHVCIVETCLRKYICDDCEHHAAGEHVCEDCRIKWNQLRRRLGTRTATVTVRGRRARKDAQRSRILRRMR